MNTEDEKIRFNLDESLKSGPSGPPPIVYAGGTTIPGLPTRADLVRRTATGKKSTADVEKKIDGGKPLLFMPVDVNEQNDFENGVPVYKIHLFGALQNGSKAHVVVDDAKLFFDVRVPEGLTTEKFANILRASTAASRITATFETVSAFPLLGFREEPVDWVRLSFLNNQDRKKALSSVHDSGYETAMDKTSNYFQTAALFHGFNLANWNLLRNYTYFKGGAHRDFADSGLSDTGLSDTGLSDTGLSDTGLSKYGPNEARNPLSPLAEHVFRVSAVAFEQNGAKYAPGIVAFVDPMAEAKAAEKIADFVEKNDELSRAKVLVMTWDIETYKKDKTIDGPPRAENPGDCVFMIGITIHWKDDPKPLEQICLIDMNAEPDSRWHTVVCGSETNIVRAFAAVYRHFAPDIIAGFNDGDYDWPFVVETATNEKILGEMFDAMNALPRSRWGRPPGSASRNVKLLSPSTDENVRKWNYRAGRDNKGQKIKISAEQSEYVKYLKVPGCVPVDTRIMFKKLFSKKELGSKQSSLNFYLKMCGLDSKADMPFTKIWKYYEEKRQKEMRYVAHYCIVDALRCQELLVKRNVVNDNNEKVSLSFTSLNDAVYYADSSKVGNMLVANAVRRNILITSCVSETNESGKYPGAFVFHPKKGIYPDPTKPGTLEFEKARTAFLQTGKILGDANHVITGKPADSVAARDAAVKSILASAAEGSLHVDYPAVSSLVKNYRPGRPITGLDFSSLYPSIIMAYNLSPEKFVATPEKCEHFRKKGYTLNEVNFVFNGEPVVGWFVWHENDPKKMGLFPTILKNLFDRRSEMKKKMAVFEELKEHIEHVMALGEKASRNKTPLAGVFAAEITEEGRRINALQAEVAERAAAGKEVWRVKNEIASHQRNIGYMSKIVALGPAKHAEALDATYADASFHFMSIDAKQKALKIYMNTFYGVAGSRISPFFLLEFAGGVTSKGQYNIKLVADFVLEKKFEIKYGDTDSLYLSCPDSAFLKADLNYLLGVHKTKEDYWTTLVKITMRELDKLRDEVNRRLKDDNGTSFLKMAYEEVLFPAVMTGKKKYYGVAHVNIPNFHPKRLFIRGIEVVKQGQTELAKKTGSRIMWRSVGLDNTQSVFQITQDVIRDAVVNSEQWHFDDFKQSAAWKPDKKNITVQTFIARMRARIEREKQENELLVARGLPPKTSHCYIPDIGGRFWYVLVKQPSVFSIHGTRLNLKKGDVMEYAEVARALSLEIDIGRYFTGSLVGLCARFINHDERFQSGVDDPKAADKAAQKAAMKYLTDYIKKLRNEDPETIRKRGYAYRRAWKKADKDSRSALWDRAGLVVGDTLHGDALSWGIYTAPDSEAVEQLADQAAKIAGAVDHSEFCRQYHDKFAKGDGRLVPAIRALDLRHFVSECARLEENIRRDLVAILPAVRGVAARYEVTIARLVSENRAQEHDKNNELGDFKEDGRETTDTPPFAVGETERAALLRLRDLWYRLLGVRVSRDRHEALVEYLNTALNRRLGVVRTRSPLEVARLVSDGVSRL